jgi:hypothetical protein
VAAAAAVAFCLAAERQHTCEQGRCQHAERCLHWTSHHLILKENATSWKEAHYFFRLDLYPARELVREVAAEAVAVGAPART